MRHAWLIIAHNEFNILQRLVSALDASDCTFFIHIDKKVKRMPAIHAEHGEVIFLTNRVDVRWGSVSQIQCEFALMKAATAAGYFDYYHIVSGTTLPLKSWEVINNYFIQHAGSCILTGLCKSTEKQETLKLRRYNLFLKHYSSQNSFIKLISQWMWKVSISIQQLFGIEKNRGEVYFKASNWLSLTHKATRHLLSIENDILKKYRYSFCGDEYFVPSELSSSILKDSILNDEHYLLHYIERSNASTFHLSEYDTLCKTDYLFARKFTTK